MINMVVPPSQVCDTSDLFHLKGQRKLSLRFLAMHVLGHSIQTDTHDSIEDARTALALYTRHQLLVAEGKAVLENTLRKLYHVGAMTNFASTPTPTLPPGMSPVVPLLPPSATAAVAATASPPKSTATASSSVSPQSSVPAAQLKPSS